MTLLNKRVIVELAKALRGRLELICVLDVVGRDAFGTLVTRE